MDPAAMIRIAFGPDGLVVPDFAGKLPGRGAWIVPSRDAVTQAVKSGAFARAAKSKVNMPDGFADIIENGLRLRVLGLLGMAKRAGEIETGFDKVRGAAQSGLLAYRFEALDGSEDGRSTIRASAKSAAYELEETPPPCVGVFTGAELGATLGREYLVHVGLSKGRVAKSLRQALTKLAGFTSLVPQTWPDTEHEPPFIPTRYKHAPE